jgi:hypothetical protein
MELVPKALLDGVIRVFDPVQVILFGSRARGDAARTATSTCMWWWTTTRRMNG